MTHSSAVRFLLVFVALFFFSAGAAGAYVALIPAGAPVIITTPDYVDSYRSPPAMESAGQIFLSREGYLFTLDDAGRRKYLSFSSYVLAPAFGSIPLFYTAAPMYVPQTGVTFVAAPVLQPLYQAPCCILVP